MATGTSSSSLAMVPVLPQLRRHSPKMSLEMTSSFFWSSPWTLVSPARPVMLDRPALVTSELICLQASAIELSTTAISFLMFPFISCFSSHVVKVMIPSFPVVNLDALCGAEVTAEAWAFPSLPLLGTVFCARRPAAPAKMPRDASLLLAALLAAWWKDEVGTLQVCGLPIVALLAMLLPSERMPRSPSSMSSRTSSRTPGIVIFSGKESQSTPSPIPIANRALRLQRQVLPLPPSLLLPRRLFFLLRAPLLLQLRRLTGERTRG
mmetsp:Transcript_661/g.1551  ORF Transcript_661/g.1551 Transcript_661/m.1551 type:complete len:265 (+) Transcript_661:814-1608(+)